MHDKLDKILDNQKVIFKLIADLLREGNVYTQENVKGLGDISVIEAVSEERGKQPLHMAVDLHEGEANLLFQVSNMKLANNLLNIEDQQFGHFLID